MKANFSQTQMTLTSKKDVKPAIAPSRAKPGLHQTKELSMKQPTRPVNLPSDRKARGGLDFGWNGSVPVPITSVGNIGASALEEPPLQRSITDPTPNRYPGGAVTANSEAYTPVNDYAYAPTQDNVNRRRTANGGPPGMVSSGSQSWRRNDSDPNPQQFELEQPVRETLRSIEPERRRAIHSLVPTTPMPSLESKSLGPSPSTPDYTDQTEDERVRLRRERANRERAAASGKSPSTSLDSSFQDSPDRKDPPRFPEQPHLDDTSVWAMNTNNSSNEDDRATDRSFAASTSSDRRFRDSMGGAPSIYRGGDNRLDDAIDRSGSMNDYPRSQSQDFKILKRTSDASAGVSDETSNPKPTAPSGWLQRQVAPAHPDSRAKDILGGRRLSRAYGDPCSNPHTGGNFKKRVWWGETDSGAIPDSQSDSVPSSNEQFSTSIPRIIRPPVRLSSSTAKIVNGNPVADPTILASGGAVASKPHPFYSRSVSAPAQMESTEFPKSESGPDALVQASTLPVVNASSTAAVSETLQDSSESSLTVSPAPVATRAKISSPVRRIVVANPNSQTPVQQSDVPAPRELYSARRVRAVNAKVGAEASAPRAAQSSKPFQTIHSKFVPPSNPVAAATAPKQHVANAELDVSSVNPYVTDDQDYVLLAGLFSNSSNTNVIEIGVDGQPGIEAEGDDNFSTIKNKKDARNDKRLQQEQRRKETEARTKAEAEARVKAEADARAKAESDARAKAEADARAKAEAEVRAKAEGEARVKAAAEVLARAKAAAEADMRAKAEAELRAKFAAEAEAKAKADVLARAKADLARVKQEADQRAKVELDDQRQKVEALKQTDQFYAIQGPQPHFNLGAQGLFSNSWSPNPDVSADQSQSIWPNRVFAMPGPVPIWDSAVGEGLAPPPVRTSRISFKNDAQSTNPGPDPFEPPYTFPFSSDPISPPPGFVASPFDSPGSTQGQVQAAHQAALPGQKIAKSQSKGVIVVRSTPAAAQGASASGARKLPRSKRSDNVDTETPVPGQEDEGESQQRSRVPQNSQPRPAASGRSIRKQNNQGQFPSRAFTPAAQGSQKKAVSRNVIVVDSRST